MALFAFDDLPDAAAMKANLLRDLAERQPSLLRFGERLAACAAGGLGFSLIALLGGADRFAQLLLGVVGHRSSVDLSAQAVPPKQDSSTFQG